MDRLQTVVACKKAWVWTEKAGRYQKEQRGFRVATIEYQENSLSSNCRDWMQPRARKRWVTQIENAAPWIEISICASNQATS